MSDVRRIAILGGGIASLSTALELTSAPDWQTRYDITVYQMGWRLGGKGASSRNPAASGRIEEHGLHVWFGCYDHAFRLLRGCYDELGRPADAPFPTMESAFTPQNVTPYFERIDDAWTVWPLWFPPNPSRPGTGGPMPSIWDDLVMAMEAIVHGAEAMLHLTGPAPAAPPSNRRTPASSTGSPATCRIPSSTRPTLSSAPSSTPPTRWHAIQRPTARSSSRPSCGCSNERRTGC